VVNSPPECYFGTEFVPPWRRDLLGDEEARLRELAPPGRGVYIRLQTSLEALETFRVGYRGPLRVLNLRGEPFNITPWWAVAKEPSTLNPEGQIGFRRITLRTTRHRVLGASDIIVVIADFEPGHHISRKTPVRYIDAPA
jgi:hypothetical protein